MAIRTESEYEAMYREHYPDVLRFVARRAEPAQADDIVGETFLTAWRKRAELPAEVRPWLFATARNSMLNAGRGSRRRQALAVRIADRHDQDHDPAPQVDARLDLATAWRRLSTGDQEALALVVWDGLSDTEAADVLGCSPSAFRMRLSRARARLRELLQLSAVPVPAAPAKPAAQRGAR